MVSPSSATPICQPPCSAVVDTVCKQPVPFDRRAINQRRHHQCQYGRRCHSRLDGYQGRQHHLPAPPKQPAAAPAAKPAAAPVAKKASGHGHGSSEPMPANKDGYLRDCCGILVDRRLCADRFPGALYRFRELACSAGYMVVRNVKPALHTPLMSVTNAVSSIIAIGALVQIAPTGSRHLPS